MPHYLVLAYDGTDADAMSRRMAARPAHFEGIKPMLESGEVVSGGALLDDDGKMIGSAMMVNFKDRAGLDAWLKRDPYVTGNVWQRIEVKPMQIAGVPNR
ncbi:MAG TPA: YciI family protein [Vineibacter sp.]|nr:YciI family protein [Vineibacter sp.]